MIQVVIGTQPNQYIPQRVLEYSIRKHTSGEVEIRAERQSARHVGGTKFGFVRFTVPHIFGYRGKAIYMDADQIVLRDIRELVDALDDKCAIGLVQKPVGEFAGNPMEPRNETSVMVMNCEKLRDWNPATMFDRVVHNRADLAPGQIHYKSFMRLEWFDPSLIRAIDPCWNHYNVLTEESKLVHFSHVRSQPWKRPGHPLTTFWEAWLREAVREGYVRPRDVVKAVALLHLHPRFLPHAFA